MSCVLWSQISKFTSSVDFSQDEKEIQVTATLQANDREAILAAVGKTVAVRGKVHDIGRTRSGSIRFINFTGNSRGQFVGIVKKENLDLVTASLGFDLKTALPGRTVELRGEIILYKDIPEIIVTSGNQIWIFE